MAKLLSNLLFGLFLTANLLVNMDHGSIPAITTDISSYFSLSKSELGALGSQVFVGTTVGGILAGFTYQKLNAKYIQVLMMLLTAFFMLVFPYTFGWWVYLCRFVTGFCQAFLTVYYTVWIDLFSPPSASTIWITILQLTAPIGIITGYTLTSLVGENWTYSFYIQGALYIPCALFLMLFPNRMITCAEKKDGLLEETGESIWLSLRSLIMNPIYVCSFLCLSTLYFTVSGVQFWGSNYLETAFNMSEATLVPVYAAIAFSAPTLGVAFGGFLCHKIGGYRDSKAPGLCLICMGIALLSDLPAPWATTWWLFVILVWFTFFFGGAVVPVITGIMVHSLSNKVKKLGVPIAVVLSNCLGYLPAPVVYGYVCDVTGVPSSGMLVALYWSALGILFLVPVCIKIKKNE